MEDNITALMEEFPITPVDAGTPPPNLGPKTGGGSEQKTVEEVQAEMDAIAGLT
jgi:hypothetical protein